MRQLTHRQGKRRGVVRRTDGPGHRTDVETVNTDRSQRTRKVETFNTDRPQRTRDVETGAPKTRSAETKQEIPWPSAPRGHKRPRSHSVATLTSAPTTATQQRADVSAETGTQTDEPRNVVVEALTSVLATRPELATVQQHLEDTFNFQIRSLLTVRGTGNSVPQLVDMLGRARKKARGLLPSPTPNPAPLRHAKPAQTQSSSSGQPATFYNAPEMEVEPPRPVTESTAPSPSIRHVPAQDEDMDDISDTPRGDMSCLAAVTKQPRNGKTKARRGTIHLATH